LIAVRPAYASILGFYGPVFVAQLEAAAETSPAAIDIDASLLEMKSKEGFSLIEPAAFPIDLPAARNLLRKICHIAASSGKKLKGTGQALLEAMDAGLVADDCFGEALLEKGQLSSLADQLAVAADMLSLLIHLAARPSVEKGARRLAGRLAGNQADRNNCPICGSVPIIGELDHEGRQWLHCGRCWHRWPARRLACPFCNNRDSDNLEYIFSADEPEYRVNLCGECRRYVKVVDVRKIDRCFYPSLEQVASLHLDMLATENGYCQIYN
jgi:FdhE protein